MEGSADNPAPQMPEATSPLSQSHALNRVHDEVPKRPLLKMYALCILKKTLFSKEIDISAKAQTTLIQYLDDLDIKKNGMEMSSSGTHICKILSHISQDKGTAAAREVLCDTATLLAKVHKDFGPFTLDGMPEDYMGQQAKLWPYFCRIPGFQKEKNFWIGQQSSPAKEVVARTLFQVLKASII